MLFSFLVVVTNQERAGFYLADYQGNGLNFRRIFKALYSLLCMLNSNNSCGNGMSVIGMDFSCWLLQKYMNYSLLQC